eukprot:g4218.t1
MMIRKRILRKPNLFQTISRTFSSKNGSPANPEPQDHRALGTKQQLYSFHETSPGSPYFLPRGLHIFNRLKSYLQQEYRIRHYNEVSTPILFKNSLWHQSGHFENYKENIFFIEENLEDDGDAGETGSEVSGLKPMNCPAHCQIFADLTGSSMTTSADAPPSGLVASYRQLPLRIADFSPLHRNEASGALTGLTRVRCFHQDDAHIFCINPDDPGGISETKNAKGEEEDPSSLKGTVGTSSSQIEKEVLDCLDMVSHFYGLLGLAPSFTLSTRPEDKYIGKLETWERAEGSLRRALEVHTEGKSTYTINEGDGAFYGPKIDVYVEDNLKRSHQCATIQLDFQLPSRFGLQYQSENGENFHPCIIHRAILGSVERMMAILVEHTQGKWPLWLSPRQVAVIPVKADHMEYAHYIKSAIEGEFIQKSAEIRYNDIVKRDDSLSVDSAESNEKPPKKSITRSGILGDESSLQIDILPPFGSKGTLGKRIRDAQIMQYNHVLVVGDKEMEGGFVNVRHRNGYLPEDRRFTGELNIGEFTKCFAQTMHEFM